MNFRAFQYNHSIYIGIIFTLYKLTDSISLTAYLFLNYKMYYTVLIGIISGLLLLFSFRKKNIEEWKLFALFSLMMVGFPYYSADYTLIMLIIPIIEYILSDDNKKYFYFSILFGLLLIPMNWIEGRGLNGEVQSIGLILKPLIIIIFISSIVLSECNIETIDNKKDKIIKNSL